MRLAVRAAKQLRNLLLILYRRLMHQHHHVQTIHLRSHQNLAISFRTRNPNMHRILSPESTRTILSPRAQRNVASFSRTFEIQQTQHSMSYLKSSDDTKGLKVRLCASIVAAGSEDESC
jgi:hypothetical protein